MNSTKNNGVARLIPFTYSLGQTMVIEVGAGYFRFHTQGGTLQYSGDPLAWIYSSNVSFFAVNTGGFHSNQELACSWTAHGLNYGDTVSFETQGGSVLPRFLTAHNGYYVANVIDANNFVLGLRSIGLGTITPITTLYPFTMDTGSGVSLGHRYYNEGDVVTYSGSLFQLDTTSYESGSSGAPSNPPWSTLNAGTFYELANSYQAADLFDIHYAQSADVLTLVHPNYPPSELRRLNASTWTFTQISFGPPLTSPSSVTATPSPGFLAQIKTITLANPALITTVSNHTLALGDGVYVTNLTAVIGGVNTVMDGFYMVSNVPVDTSGNLINDELNLADYSGNVLDSSGWSSYHATDGTNPITIQYGTKIFNITNNYAVTAIGADGVSSSILSASVSALNNLDVPGSYNTIAWSAVPNTQSYYVFKQFNGLWGFIGSTQATTFSDDNIAPDMSIVPGTPDAVFSSAGNYPGAVCYFEQRRCFAGTDNAPQNCWMSNSGTESMFSYSLPSLATDRLAFRVAALKADTILHLVPMVQLIMLTAESEFALVPVSTDVLTPSSINVKAQSYVGAGGVQPTIINTSMVYAAARGGHVRELGYAWTVNGFMTGDLSLRAAHLFDSYNLVDQGYAKAPWPIVWFVSSSGKLLGLTYIPEEQVGAWHQHDTDGTFESIACVAEGTQDYLYAVVNRTVNGQTVRYVERMASSIIDEADPSTWFFVDAGITQTFGSPVTQVSGLTWLEGCTVAVLADGGVQSQKTVTGGTITLDHAATTVTVGLPYTSDLQTLPMVLQIDGFGQGITKNVNKAWLRVFQSSGVLIGPDEDHLTEIKQRTTEPWGSPPALQSAILPVTPLTAVWQDDGFAFIRQENPLPLTVVGLTMEVAIGG